MISVELLAYEGDEVTSSVRLLLEREFSFPTTVTTVKEPRVTDVAAAAVDDFFAWMCALRPQVETIIIFLVPTRLFTAFDHEIVAETRANRVVVATPRLSQRTLPRVLRHEIGRVMGLKDHWDCVMSRQFVENPTFCIQCRAILLERGIAWRVDPSQQVSDTTRSG